MSDYYSIKEFSEVLGINPNTAYKMVREGSVKAIRCGKAIRIKKTDIDGIKEKGGNDTSAERP